MKYIILVIVGMYFIGCSAVDNDLKTSNCRAKVEFNCDCTKDNGITTEVIEGLNIK